MKRYDGLYLPGENGETGLTFSQALFGWKRVSKENVATLKKYLSIPPDFKMAFDLFPRMDTRCKMLFEEMRTIGLLAPPEPDGTRSSPSMKMNIFSGDSHNAVGFCIWTTENSIWVIFY